MPRKYHKQKLEPLLPVQKLQRLSLNLGQARTELRLLRSQNTALLEEKHRIAALRARMADHFYGLSLLAADIPFLATE